MELWIVAESLPLQGSFNSATTVFQIYIPTETNFQHIFKLDSGS
jgi:hypothetical protein